jgi:hypothetical protein
MTVCTHEVTLRDLDQDPFLAVGLADQVADVAHLLMSWTVVPLHCDGRENTAAVHARTPGLHVAHPFSQPGVVALLLSESSFTGSLMICRVVHAATLLAPCLQATSTAMELVYRLHRPTTTTTLAHCCHLRHRVGPKWVKSPLG